MMYINHFEYISNVSIKSKIIWLIVIGDGVSASASVRAAARVR